MRYINEFDLLMVTTQEMEGMCKNADWMMEKVYTSENGAYTAVLRKKI